MAETTTSFDDAAAWAAARCTPGTGSGTLARFGPVVLLVGSTDAEAVRPLLDQAATVAANGGQGRQLVRSLALMLATAPDEGPAFVALAPHGTGLAVFVQGAATVTVGAETISGADSLAWVERLVPWPLDGVAAEVDGSVASGSPGLFRLDAGVVPAGSVSLRPDGAAPEPEPAPAPEPEPAPEPVVEPLTPTEEMAPPTPAAPTPPAPEPPAPAPTPAAAPPAAAGRPVPAPVPDENLVFDSVLLKDVDVDDEPPAPLPIVSHHHEVPEAQPGAEQVRGVFCKNRHFNDPRQLFCAVCGINMVQQTPVLVDGRRPPLGVVVLDDGSVFQLDTAYLLGRDPDADERVAGGGFRGLPIIDQSHQVSRVHARLELRGWDVVIVDNSSTNGTFVAQPGAPEWARLPPGGEVVLTQGTRIRIGHRTLAFNTHGGASA